jgi:alkylation response protein AidB-like acyl-CoA dehydrogenase
MMERDELAMLRASVRRMLDRACPNEQVQAWEQADFIPRELIRDMAELGILGLATPEAFGGLGREVVAMITVMEELAARWQAICALYNQSVGYGSLNIAGKGSAAQRARFLPPLLAGDLLFSYGLSEPDVGADLANVRTTAERRDDQIVVRGAKRWISGADLSDYMVALVRSGAPEDRRRNLSFVLIPTDAPGVTLTRTPCMGTKGVATHDVALDDVVLPADLVLGEEAGWNNGWNMLAGPVLEIEKLVPSAIALGVAQAAFDEAWAYSQTRVQFGVRICGHQAVRHALAEAKTRLKACRLMLYDAAAKVEAGEDSALDTSMAKLFVATEARAVVLACQEVMGAYGYAQGFNMERYVRDILATPIYGGSNAIQRNNIANLAGLPRA